MLHTRLNRITADTAALDGCVTYIEREIRPALEARPGSLGISVLISAPLISAPQDRGVAIFGSVWATSDEMSGSEDTESPMRGELARRAGGQVTVEDYAVPIFELVERQAPPRRGFAVRLTRIQVRPSQVDDVIEVVGEYAVPSLIETPGFCDALLFAHQASGRLISETVWRDAGARAGAPSVAAILQTEAPGEVTSPVEDYVLVFSTVREPLAGLLWLPGPVDGGILGTHIVYFRFLFLPVPVRLLLLGLNLARVQGGPVRCRFRVIVVVLGDDEVVGRILDVLLVFEEFGFLLVVAHVVWSVTGHARPPSRVASSRRCASIESPVVGALDWVALLQQISPGSAIPSSASARPLKSRPLPRFLHPSSTAAASGLHPRRIDWLYR